MYVSIEDKVVTKIKDLSGPLTLKHLEPIITELEDVLKTFRLDQHTSHTSTFHKTAVRQIGNDMCGGKRGGGRGTARRGESCGGGSPPSQRKRAPKS